MKVFIRSTIIVLCALAFSICAVAATNSLLKVFRKSNAAEDPIEINQASQFTFNELEDGTVEVTGPAQEYTGGQPLIINIPSADPNGKDVSKIGDYAFQEKFDGFRVTSITLPETLKIIGKGAFSPADDLLIRNQGSYAPTRSSDGESFKEIIIPNSVTEIGEDAFRGCACLKTITFAPESQLKTIGANAFGLLAYNPGYSIYSLVCGITSIEIPSSVVEIGEGAFRGCDSLTSVTFQPDSHLQKIAPYTFAGYIQEIKYGIGNNSSTSYLNKLSQITIPKSVTEIGDHAFYLCESLKDVEFEQGSNLQIIGDYAFAGTTYASEFYSSSYSERTSYSLSSNKIEQITIPKSVTTIGSHAFYCCENLETVNFEEESNLQTIGDYAFAGVIFQSSYGLSFVGGPPTHTSTDSKVTNKISTITIPKSVTTIGSHAFYCCENLETVNFDSESNVQTIGAYAFAGAIFVSSSSVGSSTQSKVTNNISTITIPKSVTSIGSHAFYCCENLETVNFEEESKLEMIYDYAFAGDISDGVAGSAQIKVTNKISTITIPKSVTSIGARAFYACENLATVNFDTQSQLKTIGASAFSGCTGLTGQYIIPESVETIGSGAFSGCTGIDLFILANKSKYDAFKSRLDAEKTTYVVKISYKTSTGITQTDNKLYKKDLFWALVGDTWQSGQEYNMPAGSWLLGEETIDKDQLDAKMQSGDIDTDITLIDDSLTHKVNSNKEEIYGTSEEGVSKDLNLKVEEITEEQAIRDKLADKYSANIKKVYVIELQQGSSAYLEETDLVIYFNESLADGLGVYLLNEELEKQTAQDGYYTYQGNNCTLVVIDEAIRYLKENPFTAETSEPAGFEEGTTLTVQSITDEADMQEQLEEAYNRLVKRVYVVQLTGGEIPSGVTISSTDNFEGYTVKVLQEGELVEWTGEYSYTEGKLILALLVEPKMSITESGFTAETSDPLGFPEDVTLTVTEITDIEELKERLGDNYNSRIKKMYIIELKKGEEKYTDETVKIYVDKAFANDLQVYIIKDTPELQTPTDRYELEGTEVTLILEEKITPPAKEETKPDNWKPWVIVGIIFGIYLLLLLLLIILLIIKRKKREKMQNKTLKK